MSLGPRRFLPPLSWLQAFEATARLGAVTRAAQELNLTQSALSRQIQALESQLEVPLFSRERQSLKLTPGGQVYLSEVRNALNAIAKASLNLRADPLGLRLNLAVLPAFATDWLAPRLPGFLAQAPEVHLNLVTRLGRPDLEAEGLDGAIAYGPQAEFPDGLRLWEEVMVPVCAPDLALRIGLGFDEPDPARLRRAPLLHMMSRPDAWEGWFAAAGLEYEPVHGWLCDQFSVLMAQAEAGLGLALLPAYLARERLFAGRLVEASPHGLKTGRAYWLIHPSVLPQDSAMPIFLDWLMTEARKMVMDRGHTDIGP